MHRCPWPGGRSLRARGLSGHWGTHGAEALLQLPRPSGQRAREASLAGVPSSQRTPGGSAAPRRGADTSAQRSRCHGQVGLCGCNCWLPVPIGLNLRGWGFFSLPQMRVESGEQGQWAGWGQAPLQWAGASCLFTCRW